MNGNVQTIFTNGNDILLFRLRRDTTSDDGFIQMTGPAVNLILGNAAGGGLQLNQGASTVSELNIGLNTLTLIGSAVSTNTSLGKISANGGNIYIQKQQGATHAGTLRFKTGSTINNFSMNLDPAVTRDTVIVADDVNITGNLALTKGKIVMAAGKKLRLTSSATITGGSTGSFVDGIMNRTGNSAFTYHVGKGTKYAPVEFSNETGPGTNTYDVQYFNGGYGNYTVNPATLLNFPDYVVSPLEWWDIDRTGSGAVDITFNYTDVTSLINVPNAIRMAHFSAVDWNDLGGTPGVANTNTSGNVKVNGINSFSPFTFSAATIGVIPVKLNSFTVQKAGNSVNINWSTSVEINSREFAVERSADGINWNTIDIVPASGNSQSVRYYSSIDMNPAKGINFYRIRQVDLDNRMEFSATRQVLFQPANEVLVTPNPAGDHFNIYLNGNGNAQILVTDISGKLVRKYNSSQNHIIVNSSNLPSGIYYVKVISTAGVRVNRLVIR